MPKCQRKEEIRGSFSKETKESIPESNIDTVVEALNTLGNTMNAQLALQTTQLNEALSNLTSELDDTITEGDYTVYKMGDLDFDDFIFGPTGNLDNSNRDEDGEWDGELP